MSTKNGLLLEHFARLAANVAGTSAAVVGVRGRRSEREPALASFGLGPAQSVTLTEINRILQSEPGLTMVPDLAQDTRFAGSFLSSEHSELRFLAYLKLLSAGGEHVGFICVLDESPRNRLTEAQAASLVDIAGMIMADRRREQRHLHLMHVANRALRVDKILRLVSEATSCADALTSLLEELCRFHGAAIGRIWQMVRLDGPMQEISRYDRPNETVDNAELGEPILALAALTADAVRRNEPHASRFSPRASSEAVRIAAEAGLTGQVAIPIWVQQQRFGILLTFTAEHPDLESVVADIASLADTIRPALFRKVTEERIRFVAHHDDLTQLPNRLMFHERLDRALATARCDEQGFALLYLDLDGFKQVNDARGHEIGDRLLTAVAQRLLHNTRGDDTVARMGGDEFAVIQLSGAQPSAAIALAKRLLHAIGQPYEVEGRQAMIGVSIGIAVYPQDGETPDLLLRSADAALYRAKEAGRNTFLLSDPVMKVHQHERFLIEQDLRNAIEGSRFTLAYQPVRENTSLRIVGFEALLRWNHASRGPIGPETFIPLAESSGLIIPLGRWAMESACVEAATWELPVYLSVNLSPLQFRQPDLSEQIAAILSRSGLPAERLELEVTEGLLLDQSDLVLGTMRRLQEQGIRITLDDFGTAYASLSYLRRFPFDRIKIDKSFIRGICDDESTLAIVQAILSLGARLNLTVIAEGVESERELDLLRDLGCHLVQGYFSGRPISSQRARELLRQQRDGNGARRPDTDSDHARSGRRYPCGIRGLAASPSGPTPYEQGDDGK